MPLAEAEIDWTRSHPNERLIIGVGVDGSANGDRALEAAAAIFVPKRGDKLVLLHVSDSTKTYLPRHLQPRHLESSYADRAFALRVPTEWACAEKAPGQSTYDALTALAEARRVALLVVGSFGRKGEKSAADALGSVSESSLRRSNCSVLVVRGRRGGGGGGGLAAAVNGGGGGGGGINGGGINGGGSGAAAAAAAGAAGVRYLIATDFSRAAGLAFWTLVRLIARPGLDSVVVATASYDHAAPAQEEERFAPYKRALAARGVAGECVTWHVPKGSRVSEGVLEVLAARQIDVLAVGIGGCAPPSSPPTLCCASLLRLQLALPFCPAPLPSKPHHHHACSCTPPAENKRYGKGFKLGSVSEELATRAPCSTLILKDTGDAGGGGAAAAGARGIAGMVMGQAAAKAAATAAAGAGLRAVDSLARTSPRADGGGERGGEGGGGGSASLARSSLRADGGGRA